MPQLALPQTGGWRHAAAPTKHRAQRHPLAAATMQQAQLRSSSSSTSSAVASTTITLSSSSSNHAWHSSARHARHAATAAGAAAARAPQQPLADGFQQPQQQWQSAPAAASAAAAAVQQFYAALNARDAASLAACLSSREVRYTNLALAGDPQVGSEAVAAFLSASMAALPADAQLLVEAQAGGGGAGGSEPTSRSTTAAVVWRLVLSASDTTVSRGVAFFTLQAEAAAAGSSSGSSMRIVSIVDSPEHQVKLDPAGVTTFAPLLASAQASVQQMSRTLQEGAGLLLQPLGALLPQQALATAAAPSIGSSFSQPTPSARASTSSSSSSVPSQRIAVAAAAASDGSATASPQAPNLSGLWAKVPERSDVAGYEAALDVLGLNGLQKVTARLIEGMEVRHTPQQFAVDFVTVVPFFRVTEAVPLDCGATTLGRRDLRAGRQDASAATMPDGSVRVQMSWGAPLAGSLTERYRLLEDGCLEVAAETSVGDRVAMSTTVYARSAGGRRQLLQESKRRNPSVAAVVQRQREQGLRVD